jgi:hypothetical protein
MMMSKLFLSVAVLAFGSFISVGGTHAALRVGDSSVMSLTSSVPKPSCRTCDLYVVPRPGEMTTLDARPLPPKTYGNGRMLRR